MNCLKKPFSFLFLFVILFSILFPLGIFAQYSSLTLYPTEGVIYGDSSRIEVFVNSGEEVFLSLNTNLSYSGTVEYIDGIGEEICKVFSIVEGVGAISIECHSEEGFEDSYNGKIATLYFKATEDGSTTFSFSNVEPDVESVAAATYSLSTESNPEEGQLPEAGIFNSYTVILSGFVLLIVGLFFNQLMNGFSFLSSRSKQAKMERRRNNLESKI